MAFKSDKQRKGFYASQRRMNKSLQVVSLKRELERNGIDPDKIDLHAEVDSSLRYGENKANLMKKISVDPERYYGDRLDDAELAFEKDQARNFHEQRSALAQRIDESRTAKDTITDRQIVKNPIIINMWYKEPNKKDIQGVDDI